MEKSENYNQMVFEGAGYLLGGVTSILTAILVLFVSKNIVVAISSSIPIGTTIGIILEQKFQQKSNEINPKSKKILIGLLFLGVLLFVSLLLLKKYI